MIPRLLVFLAVCASCSAAELVDRALPDYLPAPALSGHLVVMGSSTVSNLVNRWTEDVQRVHRSVSIEVIGGGTANAPASLADGRSQCAPMTRPMTVAEIGAYSKKRGHPPLGIAVAIDALAVLVNRENPVASLTLTQLDSLLGAERKRGAPPIDTWGDCGLGESWNSEVVVAYGPHPWQGSHALITDIILQGGRMRHSLQTGYGPSDLAQGVAVERGGLALTSVLYANKRTRSIPLQLEDGSVVDATPETCASGRYPLARRLYLYVDRIPGKPLDPLIHEFLAFALSRDGQRAVADLGMFPLTAAVASEQRLLTK